MKQKILSTAIVLAMGAMIVACGSENKEETTPVETTQETTTIVETTQETTQPTTDIVIQPTTTAPTTKVVEKATVKTTTAPKQPTTQSQKPKTPDNKPRIVSRDSVKAGTLGVTFKGKKVMLNTNIASANLGSTTDYSEAPSCNYDGLDKVFTYGDVSFYTYPHSSGDLINEIEVNDTSVVTDKGIAPIGKSLADIKSVYGEPTNIEGETYKYKNGNCYTYFYVDGDSISYWGVAYEQ